MEDSSMNASPTKGVERVVAAKKARERETNASGQLTAPEAAGRRETKEPCPMETAKSMGAREINVPEKETAAVRRDGEPLAGAAMKRRQEEAAADRHQAAAGERPPSSVREGIRPVPLSATDPGRKMRGAVGSDRPQLAAAKADRIETSCNEPSVIHMGGDLIEWMERQRPTAGRSVEGSWDIDVERHSCSTTDQHA
jgi:hypothetical protein